MPAKNRRRFAKRLGEKGMKHIVVTFCHAGGGHSEWHLQTDVTELLKLKWDMVLAFPPCTHLAVSGAAWFKEKQRDGRQYMGIGFFLQFTALDHIPMVAIENPIGIMSNYYRKPDQIIQPWQFGDPYEKSTCLWLKNLPKLKPITTEKPEMEYFDYVDKRTGKAKREQKWYMDALKLPPNERAMVRSKTFPGIAQAMADQWGALEIPALEKSTEEAEPTEAWEQITFEGI